MTDGFFQAQSIWLTPESGEVSITGGQIDAGVLDLTDYYLIPTTRTIGGSAQITVRTSLIVADGVNFSCPVHMLGADFVHRPGHEWLFPDLRGLNLIFEGGSGVVSSIEASGWPGNELSVIGAITVGGGDIGRVRLVDKYLNNESSVGDAVCGSVLSISQASVLETNGVSLFVAGDVADLLNSWIADGRIIDTTLSAGQYLEAIYDSNSGWTEVVAVPEPTALTLLLMALALSPKRR